jgi:putative MFS transporter
VPVLDRYGPTAMFGVIAGALAICILDIALFAPATTGRSLETIQVRDHEPRRHAGTSSI